MKNTLRHWGLLAMALLLGILLVACGPAPSSGTPTNTANQNMNNKNNNDTGMMNNTPTATAMDNGNMNNGTPMATATAMDNGNMNGNNNGDMNGNNGNMMDGVPIAASMTGNMNAFIHTGKATINGNQVNVLLSNKGFALYYYKPDMMNQASCTGMCAQDWPPVLAPQGMMTISSSVALPKQLSVHQTPNGMQIFYDTHALYTYAADKQANTATGRGQDGQWYLVGFQL